MHLFEFVDQDWVPSSIHITELELLESCLTLTGFFKWVSDQVLDYARQRHIEQIVELGAGTAPIVRLLAQDSRTDGMRLIVCDLKPQAEVYEVLEEEFPEKVTAISASVDFSKPYQWQPSTLLLIVDSFHHISPKNRLATLATLTQSADRVMVFESLHNNLMSILLAASGAILASVLVPILWFNKPGKIRRILWCWLLPVASLLDISKNYQSSPLTKSPGSLLT